MQKLLRGGTLVTESGLLKGDLLIEGEKIAQIAENIIFGELDSSCQIIDVTDKIIMPGIIDAHTHYQLESRNSTTADDFASGSISAACGGVTTFIDYADHFLDFTLAEAAKKRINEALGKTVIDFALHQSITHFDDKVSLEMAELKEMGINSIKIFTTYRREGYMIPNHQWEQVFQRLKEEELLLTVHAEDDDLIVRLEEEFIQNGTLTPEMHPLIRPAEAEAIAVRKVGELSLKVGIPVYIAHLSSKAGFNVLESLKTEGVMIYAETTPHYLLLDVERLKECEAQKYIMTPPLRNKDDLKALWEGLVKEEILTVATDHCSFTLEQKLRDNNCLTILPGLPGSETLLPLIHHYGVSEGLFDYPQLARILSTNPAKIFGIYPEKGSLLIGTDADLVILDPAKEVTISHTNLHSHSGYCPYEGFKVKGYPVMTYLRGQLVVKDGEFIGKGQGQFVKGQKSSLYN
ncbi:MAG: dihydropyrimidinase [Halanaerobiales bacterium]|nr:dihydropyrimidinase [Halanaerobiales bacterium]